MKRSILSSLLIASVMATGCLDTAEGLEVDGEDEAPADVATTESDLTVGNSISLGSVTNGCAPGQGVQLQFGGVDAAGHELYTVQNLRASNLGSCTDTIQLLVQPHKKVRIKGVSITGNYFRGGGAFGRLDVLAGLRTAPTYTVKTFFPQATAPGFSRFDFSMPANDFTQCSVFPTPGETLNVRPSAIVTGGTPGQTPSLTVDISSQTISLDVVGC